MTLSAIAIILEMKYAAVVVQPFNHSVSFAASPRVPFILYFSCLITSRI